MDILLTSLAAVLFMYAASLSVLARADSAGRILIRSAEAFADAAPVIGLGLVMAMAVREPSRQAEEASSLARAATPPQSGDVAAAPRRMGSCIPVNCRSRRG